MPLYDRPEIGEPSEIRTRVDAVKGHRPSPLDDGSKIKNHSETHSLHTLCASETGWVMIPRAEKAFQAFPLTLARRVCFNMVLGERLELPMFVCLLTKEVQSPLCQPSELIPAPTPAEYRWLPTQEYALRNLTQKPNF